MTGTTDKIKGEVKEAAGHVTGDKRMKAEGKADQAKGSLKDAVHRVGEKIADVAHSAKKAVTRKKK